MVCAKRESHRAVDRNEPIKRARARAFETRRGSNFAYEENRREKKNKLSRLIMVSLLGSATVGAVEIFKRAVNPLLSAVL